MSFFFKKKDIEKLIDYEYFQKYGRNPIRFADSDKAYDINKVEDIKRVAIKSNAEELFGIIKTFFECNDLRKKLVKIHLTEQTSI